MFLKLNFNLNDKLGRFQKYSYKNSVSLFAKTTLWQNQVLLANPIRCMILLMMLFGLLWSITLSVLICFCLFYIAVMLA